MLLCDQLPEIDLRSIRGSFVPTGVTSTFRVPTGRFKGTMSTRGSAVGLHPRASIGTSTTAETLIDVSDSVTLTCASCSRVVWAQSMVIAKSEPSPDGAARKGGTTASGDEPNSFGSIRNASDRESPVTKTLDVPAGAVSPLGRVEGGPVAGASVVVVDCSDEPVVSSPREPGSAEVVVTEPCSGTTPEAVLVDLVSPLGVPKIRSAARPIAASATNAATKTQMLWP